ncbi:hypothetical protein M569_01935 [Genlisea aurea]|uniref:S-protein homolog n=1 Tax=Genlisea aurea TaxID=192259 RepID=S8EJQ4_9LAMI|nr:hypothetical protein M569_01935 [Genlisea aurea]
MGHEHQSILLLLFLLVSSRIVVLEAGLCPLGRFNVTIFNNLPPEIGGSGDNIVVTWCKSGDRDIGDRYLDSGDYFSFDFCKHVFPNIVYFCHFYWGKKDKAIEVFRQKFITYDHQFVWRVKTDGFYMSHNPLWDDSEKKFGWD